MNTKEILAFALLLFLATAACERAVAGCAMELEVVGTTSKTIRIYDEGGKRLGEVDKSLALKQLALDCDESLGLVKVALTDKRVVWINRSETQRIAGLAQNSSVCVTESSSKDADHTVGATSGAEPTQAHCKPSKE